MNQAKTILVLVVVIVLLLASAAFAGCTSEANTEMPLVYCHSQGGVVKDGKCVKKGRLAP
jgi:predicted S18 family serine protease